MIYAGCDIGSLTAKAVIMEDDSVIAWHVMKALTNPAESAATVLEKTLEMAGLNKNSVAALTATGYGRKHVPGADFHESEISCHALGAIWQDPNIRTIIDIGGQDAKAINIDEKGSVIRYVYNDKCASGTGRFLEIISKALGVPLEKMGDRSLQSTEKLKLSHQCVVFAETEIISLASEGKEIPDILNALHHAVSGRAVSLARSIGINREVTFSGGVARNMGMFRALSESLGTEIIELQNPQINGALGAALIARNNSRNKQ
jgi:predicted CoA-substrate-specific enzyme activase